MCSFPRILALLSGFLFVYSSCSRNIFQRKDYQPPNIGAESRFDEGLRKEKHPQYLFSKKERRDMEKMGTLSKQERSAPVTKISPAQADSMLTGKVDSSRIRAADSAKVIPADTTIPQQPDTNHIPY